mgnify:CR=1 FL=1
MGLVGDMVVAGVQMLYFKLKNNSRAKAFQKMSDEHNLTFCKTPAEYKGAILSLNSSQDSQGLPTGRLSAKAKFASRMFGRSQLQVHMHNFKSNKYRGDWQTNCNIMEGDWKGHTMTFFDTVFFNTNSDGTDEGEYSSVFVHSKNPMPRMIISPTGILAGLKRLDENQMINIGYHKIQFELDEFNKSYRVVSADEKLSYGFITPKMIEYLMEHKHEKWHFEFAEGGVLISTVYTLNPKKVEMAMDFLAGFLDRLENYLKKS